MGVKFTCNIHICIVLLHILKKIQNHCTLLPTHTHQWHNAYKNTKYQLRESVQEWSGSTDTAGEIYWQEGWGRVRELQGDVVYLGWPIAQRPLYESKCGGMGKGCGVSAIETVVHITWHGAQINFGDLTPYLSYGEITVFVEADLSKLHK